MSIILAILLFSFIVFFHELGHFIAAKRCGVEVIEFSLGFGPRLLSRQWGNTRYSLKLIPFGGSNMMKGEDPEDLSEGSFYAAGVGRRILIVVAGPVFNFILAWILSVILLLNAGVDYPVIIKVTDGSPAAEAGIEAGDVIRSIDGKHISFYREIEDYSMFRQDRMQEGRPIRIVWEHQGETHSADLVPVSTEQGKYIFGISGSHNYRFRVNVPEAMRFGAAETGYWISMTVQSLKMLFTGEAKATELTGPVGVVNVVNETVEETKDDGIFYIFLNLLNLAILLSANIGVINLLPIPALDGGRLLLFLVEAVRRKRNNPQLEMRINYVGVLLILALMVFVMFNDVRRIVFGG